MRSAGQIAKCKKKKKKKIIEQHATKRSLVTLRPAALYCLRAALCCLLQHIQCSTPNTVRKQHNAASLGVGRPSKLWNCAESTVFRRLGVWIGMWDLELQSMKPEKASSSDDVPACSLCGSEIWFSFLFSSPFCPQQQLQRRISVNTNHFVAHFYFIVFSRALLLESQFFFSSNFFSPPKNFPTFISACFMPSWVFKKCSPQIFFPSKIFLGEARSDTMLPSISSFQVFIHVLQSLCSGDTKLNVLY